GQHIVIKEFNFSSGAVVFNKPIAIKIAFLLDNKEPAVTEQLSLSTSLIIDEALQKIQLANFNLDSVTKGESIPGGQLDTQLESEIFLDLQAQTLALKKLQLYKNLIHISGELNARKLNTDLQYTGALQVASFSPKELMQQLAISVPETADKQVLQKLALSFALQGTKDSIALENLKIALDDTNINGYTRIKQFDQPAVTFQLAIDDIDVDRYSAPKSQASPAKTPAARSKAVAAEAELLPMDTLRTLNINGDLKIAKLKVAQLNMGGVGLNLQAKQGILKTRQSINQLYQGRYKGQITINAKGKSPRISINEKVSNVQLEPLLTDLQPNSKAKLKGQANIAAKLKTTGNTIPAIKSTLGGKLNFSL
ncbi:MAG: AsmA family protein, partial [Thiotrichaceae bacterium]|nr:AsmA family protein [Thiotrichaceae bacterium]